MTPYPWDMAPKSIISSLPIKVFVLDLLKEDEIKFMLDLDLGNKDHRAYLGKITAWALTNKCSVETMSKNDAEGIE